MKTETLLAEYLLSANFEKAKEILSSIPINEHEKTILKVAYQTESMIVYSFLCYLLTTENNIKTYHDIAISVLINALNFFEGAYATAFYHAKLLCDLEPQNIERKELLLFFYEIPEDLLSEEIAFNLAKDILAKEPENIVAKRILNKIIHNRS